MKFKQIKDFTQEVKTTAIKRDVQKADVAQLVERIHGKDEVTSSILVIGS